MPSSQTSSYRKLLRRAQGAVRTLKTAGHSTMALEVELKRGEQAIVHKHWAEAKEHLDTVLASTPAVRPPGRAAPSRSSPEAGAAPRAFSDADRQAVADKLGLARDRLAILDQFGIATADLLTSLHRADHLLDHGYTAQAETVADELLVMTKAAAEGMAAATHHTGVIARASGNGSTAHHDFLAALRGTLADLVKTQGWLGESGVRALVAEAMGPLARASEVETRLQALAHQIEDVASALRQNHVQDQESLAARLEELRAQLDGTLATDVARLRQELAQVAATVQSDGEERLQLAQTMKRLEAALDTRSATQEQKQTDQSAQLVATLDALRHEVASSLDAWEQRVSRLDADTDGHEERVRALADTLATVQARLDALAGHERAERSQLAATIDQLGQQVQTIPATLAGVQTRSEQAQHEHAQILITLESRLDAALKDFTPIRAGLADLAQHCDQELTTLRSALTERGQNAEALHRTDDLGLRLAALEQRLGDDAGHAANANADLAARVAQITDELQGLHSISSGLAALREELAQARSAAAGHDQLAAVDQALADHGQRLAAVDQDLGTRIDTLALDTARKLAALDAASTSARQDLQARLAALTDSAKIQVDDGEKVSALQTRLDETLSALRQDLAALDQRLDDCAGKTDLADVRRDLDHLSGDQTEAEQREQLKLQVAELATAKADATRLDLMAEKFAQLLADLRQDLDARAAAQAEQSSAGDWQEHFSALATDLRASIEQTLAGKVDTAWLDQVEAGLDRRLVQQESSLIHIETALGRRKTVDESTAQDAVLARVMGLEQEVAALTRDLLAKSNALDELRAAVPPPAPAFPEERIAAIETALATRATQAESSSEQAALIPELSARIDSVALDLAGLRNLQERIADSERRLAEYARHDERLAACEAGLAASGATSATTQLPDRILQLITGSEAFRALVAREVAVARNFVNPHGDETEQVHRSVAELAQRMEHLQDRAAPAFAIELAALHQKVDELAAHNSAQVDIKQLRDQVIESLRPLIPRSDKVVEVINAAVGAAVQRLPAPAAATPDPKALRKLLPDLLTAPEIRSTIISTVLLEALSNKGSLGNLTGIRQLVHDELLHIIAEHKSSLSTGARPPVAQPPGPRPTTGH